MLKCGTAEIDVTPPINVPMAGYGTRKSGSRGVHDPLLARALVVDNGAMRIGWIIAELIGIGGKETGRIRTLATQAAGIAPDCLMVSATHTHGGPDTRPQPDTEADHNAHERYLDELPGKLAECLAVAAAKLEPATFFFGRAVTSDIQHNRRFHMADGAVLMDWENPDPSEVAFLAPVDPGLQVLVIDRERAGRAVLMQFACHATVMDSGNYMITADWPGAACRHVQRLLSVPGESAVAPWVAFAQGCCGDINPRPPKDSFEEVEAKGLVVAKAAMRAVKRAEPLRGDILKSVLVPVKVPRKEYGLHMTPTGELYEAEVQGLRLADAVVIGLPGEAFSGIGLNIKAHSEFRGAFVGSYANDYHLGYVPLSAEYNGGYEPEYSKNAPGADTVLTDAALRALWLLADA